MTKKEPMISVLDIEYPWSHTFYNQAITERYQPIRLTTMDDFRKSPIATT